MKKKIFVTGAQGYIGSVLVQKLLKQYDVIGTDIGYFKNCNLIKYSDPIKILSLDLKQITKRHLKDVYCVIHLAAISNDPIGDLNPKVTMDINYKQTIRLAKLAKNAGVSRFLFSSSCIMYGSRKGHNQVNENSLLKPLTAYAKSKVLAEKGLSKLASKFFSVTYIRNGTVYGFSPRMRFDTVLNNFIAQSYYNNSINILSKGEQYRPVIHITDVCNSFIKIMEAPKKLIHNQAFNNGDNKLNYRIKDLALSVKKVNPKTKIKILDAKNHDNRSYIASFNKIKRKFPNIVFKNKPTKSSKELFFFLSKNKIKKNIIYNKKFIRLKWLDFLKKKGKINKALKYK